MFGPSKRDLLRLLEQERKQHRHEIGVLLDRLANAHGRPWTPPPVAAEPAEQPSWTPSPEQRPVT